MLLRYSLRQAQLAERIEAAVGAVLDQGLRTADIAAGGNSIGTAEMGAAVVATLRDAGNGATA
jgi:3-isopropylmalate dehydrogenase